MRQLRLALPIAAALALAGCGQQQTAVPDTETTAQVRTILLRQDTAVVGQPLVVAVDAFDAQGRRVQVAPEDLVWESDDPSKLRIDKPGLVTPLSTDPVNLRVRTANNSTYTTYLETAFLHPLQPPVEETSGLSSQSATGRSFSQLDNTWVGKTVDVNGNTCNPSLGGECGQCTAFAKAFGNQISPAANSTTTYWKSGTAVLTRGANPTLKTGVYAGDAIATFYNGQFSTLNSSSGHVALFNGYSSGTLNVKDQNWYVNTPDQLKIYYHSIQVKNTVNGTPYCNSNYGIDVTDACNYLRVQLN